MHTLFPEKPTVYLPIQQQASVMPITRIFCVGKNYAAHAKEMGGAVSTDAPFFFIKNPHDVIVAKPAADAQTATAEVPYPRGTADLHFEVELIAVLGKPLKAGASAQQIIEAIAGYSVGIDFTKRDLQATLKAGALPWALSKSFFGAAVIAPVKLADAVQRNKLPEFAISLTQNGTLKQSGKIGDMARDVPMLIEYLLSQDDLNAGDIIFTGTPAGVGTTQIGDVLEIAVENIGSACVKMVASH